MTTNGRQWVEHVGAAGLPKGFETIPDGGQGEEHCAPGYQSGTAWMKSGGKVFRCDPLPLTLAGAAALTQAGAAGDSTVGDVNGDAVIVPAAYAENAVNGWTSADPNASNYGADDVFDLITPSSDISGITDTVYAQWKSPPSAQIWKYEPANGAGYFSGNNTNQSALQPIPAPGGTTPGTAPGTTPAKNVAASSSVLPWVLVGGAVLLAGAVAVGVAEKNKSGSERRRENPVRGAKRKGSRKGRDSHGRFK